MALKDVRPSAQWSDDGSTAALPPLTVPQRFLTGTVTAPMAVVAGTIEVTGP